MAGLVGPWFSIRCVLSLPRAGHPATICPGYYRGLETSAMYHGTVALRHKRCCILHCFSLSLFLSFFLSFFRSLKRERLPLDTRFRRSISRKVASLFDLRVHARIAVMRYKGTSFSENREFGINCSVIIRVEKRGLLEVRLKVRNDFQIIHESR